jgi:hypothetical protein
MFLDPNSFRRDPYGYLTNQAGHAYLVGAPLSMTLSPWVWLLAVPVIVAVAYGLIWELGVQRGRLWRDSLEDTVHVLAGASVMVAALTGDVLLVAECMGAQAGLLAVGVWRRS